MQPNGLCDVCGGDVAPSEAYRAEMTLGGDTICPTPMLYHRGCYEKASKLWQPDPDSYCSVDPLFPETAQWTTPT